MKTLVLTTSLLLIGAAPVISAATDETPKPVVEADTERAKSIRQLQLKLSENGYYAGPIDGIMTPELRKAAKGELRDRL